jgi:hypothetical protein
MRSLRTWLSVLLGVCVLSVCLAGSARAGVFPPPFGDETICGDIAVAPTLTGTGAYAGSSHCSALCRAVSAQCHRFVGRVSSCLTAFAVSNAAFETRNCNENPNPVNRIACRASVKGVLIGERSTIVGERDVQFIACDTWESACQATCP